jgi:hypothetical protein
MSTGTFLQRKLSISTTKTTLQSLAGRNIGDVLSQIWTEGWYGSGGAC